MGSYYGKGQRPRCLWSAPDLSPNSKRANYLLFYVSFCLRVVMTMILVLERLLPGCLIFFVVFVNQFFDVFC